MVHNPFPFLTELEKEFKEIRLEEFYPVSIWFSYGSNLFAPDFEMKMREHGSSLSLLRPRTAFLRGWRRSLNNKSATRGISYSIAETPANLESKVPGLLHDIPITDLSAFLQYEGVLNRDYELIQDSGRRYNIRRASARLSRMHRTVACYILEGNCPVSEELRVELMKKNAAKIESYVRTAIEGAIHFGVQISDLQSDLREVERAGRG